LESEEPASESGISDLEEPFEAEEPDFGEEPFGEDKGFGEDEEQYDSEEAAFGGEESEEQPEEEAPSKGRPILVAILVILGLALIGALLYLFVFMSQTEEEVPPLEAERAPVEEPEEEEPEEGTIEEPEEELVQEESRQEAGESQTSDTPSETEEETGGASESAESEAPVVSVPGEWENWDEGVWYRIRWGDTLWGISRSFYDTPWAYDDIADQNRIQNPNRIFAEKKIFIPKPD
ncbi:MAG: LysM peptidoglycan-binding domain-containing protein, partial [Spirochaetaceae bacterium]